MTLLKLFREKDKKFSTMLWILQYGDRQHPGTCPQNSTAYLQFFTPAFSGPSIYFPLTFRSPKAIPYIDINLPGIQPLFLCGMFPAPSALHPALSSCTETFTTSPNAAAQHHHTTKWSSNTDLSASEKRKPNSLLFNYCHQDKTRFFLIKSNRSLFQMRGWGSVTGKKEKRKKKENALKFY